MAFIHGYEARYHCLLCGGELTSKIKDRKALVEPLSFVYDHPIDGLLMINGYPFPCENNGKTLNRDEVEKLDMPIIDSFRRGLI